MSNISGSPHPVRVKHLVGEVMKEDTFLFSPLVDEDYGTLDMWLQGKYVENAVNGMPKGISDERFYKLYASALRSSLKVTFISKDGISLLATLHGMAFVSWLSMRKNHPEITEDFCLSMLLIEGNLREVNKAFGKVNAVPRNPHLASRARRKKRKV